MPTINITELTITRAQLADLFAEAERRIRAGEDHAPPLVDLLSLPEAGVVQADYLISLACQQAVVGHFDAKALALGQRSGQPDVGPALCEQLRLASIGETRFSVGWKPETRAWRGLGPIDAAEIQGFTDEQLRIASSRIAEELALRREAKLRGEAH